LSSVVGSPAASRDATFPIQSLSSSGGKSRWEILLNRSAHGPFPRSTVSASMQQLALIDRQGDIVDGIDRDEAGIKLLETSLQEPMPQIVRPPVVAGITSIWLRWISYRHISGAGLLARWSNAWRRWIGDGSARHWHFLKRHAWIGFYDHQHPWHSPYSQTPRAVAVRRQAAEPAPGRLARPPSKVWKPCAPLGML
jgi:hypothetical protein